MSIVTSEMSYWKPNSPHPHSRRISTAVEVQALADELLARYEVVSRLLPGIEIRRSDEFLSIAVGPHVWALIHTDAELNQQHTQRADARDDGNHDVQWDEPTSIPRHWFIPKEEAVAGLSRWLIDGTLAPELRWSDQCF